ncbi:OB-fold nucleic acid binding domain-containing protein, partial [Clostridium sp.]
GIITEVNQKVTRNNQIMAFIKIEDLSAVIEVIVFPKTLDRVRNLIATDALVVIKGRVSMKEDEVVKIICETVEPLEKVNSSKVYVRVDNLDMARASKPKLMEIATEYAGDTPLYVFTANDRKNYRMPRNMWVNLSSDVFGELEKVFGEDNVKIVE